MRVPIVDSPYDGPASIRQPAQKRKRSIYPGIKRHPFSAERHQPSIPSSIPPALSHRSRNSHRQARKNVAVQIIRTASQSARLRNKRPINISYIMLGHQYEVSYLSATLYLKIVHQYLLLLHPLMHLLLFQTPDNFVYSTTLLLA